MNIPVCFKITVGTVFVGYLSICTVFTSNAFNSTVFACSVSSVEAKSFQFSSVVPVQVSKPGREQSISSNINRIIILLNDHQWFFGGKRSIGFFVVKNSTR